MVYEWRNLFKVYEDSWKIYLRLTFHKSKGYLTIKNEVLWRGSGHPHKDKQSTQLNNKTTSYWRHAYPWVLINSEVHLKVVNEECKSVLWGFSPDR